MRGDIPARAQSFFMGCPFERLPEIRVRQIDQRAGALIRGLSFQVRPAMFGDDNMRVVARCRDRAIKG